MNEATSMLLDHGAALRVPGLDLLAKILITLTLAGSIAHAEEFYCWLGFGFGTSLFEVKQKCSGNPDFQQIQTGPAKGQDVYSPFSVVFEHYYLTSIRAQFWVDATSLELVKVEMRSLDSNLTPFTFRSFTQEYYRRLHKPSKYKHTGTHESIEWTPAPFHRVVLEKNYGPDYVLITWLRDAKSIAAAKQNRPRAYDQNRGAASDRE